MGGDRSPKKKKSEGGRGEVSEGENSFRGTSKS